MKEFPTLPKPERKPKPRWIRVKVPSGKNYKEVHSIVNTHKLHTVCQSANCPNVAECWGAGTATFMILGNICTRSCGFCAVKTGKPLPADYEEPLRVAKAIKKMGIKHAVITSVDRDDLPDGGAKIWAETIRKIKELNPETTIETLIPDFQGKWENLEIVLEARPDVLSHNMETVKRLHRRVRPQARYERSLEVIRRAYEFGLRTKSGAMLGLGETKEEILELMQDLRKNNCEILTLGQYLQPTKLHLPVEHYITPEEFLEYRKIGLEMGFRFVESAPLVRSSYHAEKHVL